jgi:hypothetical protein
MKQDRVGPRGCKPSRGWETLKADRSGEPGNSLQTVNPSDSVALKRAEPHESCRVFPAVVVWSNSEGGPSSREDCGPTQADLQQAGLRMPQGR